MVRFKTIAFVALAVLIPTTVAPSFGVTPVPPPPEEYVFVPQTTRWVEIKRGEFTLQGHLDAEGNFVHTYKHPFNWGEASSGPPAMSINCYWPLPKPVYEFRSGRLIKGEIDKRGNFVPEAGSVVTPFKDYHYKPGDLPVWNLPGYFQKKSRLSDQEKAMIQEAGR